MDTTEVWATEEKLVAALIATVDEFARIFYYIHGIWYLFEFSELGNGTRMQFG